MLRLESAAAPRGRAGVSLGLDGFEVRLCDPCARVRPCVPCVSRLPGDGGFVIEFGGVCYQDTYPMYLACILHVFRMYLDVIRSYTSRYTKIHQDTSRYICIYLFGYHGNVSYLGVFTIHLGYI